MKPTGIVLIEGADSSGKSTLAKRFIEKFDAKYIHSTVRKDIWKWHVGALRLAVRESHDRLVVLDRHWLSELVYGHVFRGGPAYDVGARCLDRVLRRFGAVTVLCSPRDQLVQAERWKRNRDAGKHEHFDRIKEVVALYADLREGNVAHPGSGYLDQLIRFQDFTQRDDVVVYDLDRDGARLNAVCGRIVDRLADVQINVFDPSYENLAGRTTRLKPGVLFVGERVSPRCSSWAPRIPRWPWCDDDRVLGAATWLNRAVHEIGLREDRIAFTNAFASEDRLVELLDAADRVIALGGVATKRIEALGFNRPAELPHPQWHRRFRYAQGVDAYGAMIVEALR